MIDMTLIREDAAAGRRALERRGVASRVDEIAELDARRRAVQTERDALKNKQKTSSKDVPKLAGDEKTALLSELSALSDEIKRFDAEHDELEARVKELLLETPNLPHESVPDGAGDDNNVELRVEGMPPAFDFEV